MKVLSYDIAATVANFTLKTRTKTAKDQTTCCRPNSCSSLFVNNCPGRGQVRLIVLCWSFQPFDAHCCHMGTAAIKYPVPDRVKPSFVIFDILAL